MLYQISFVKVINLLSYFMKKPGQDHIRYEVIVQEDKNSDDLILPIPPVLLERLGWKEGDDIEFIVDERGSWFLKKVEK